MGHAKANSRNAGVDAGICVADVRDLVEHDPVTGLLRWLPRRVEHFSGNRDPKASCATWNTKHAGREAGHADRDGYRVISIKGQRILGHRVAWYLAKGEWPSADIDHIDRDPANNRITNLRIAKQFQNSRNILKTSSKSGHRGVCPAANKWRAYIYVSGKCLHLGMFDALADAIEARNAASQKYFCEFSPVWRASENV